MNFLNNLMYYPSDKVVDFIFNTLKPGLFQLEKNCINLDNLKKELTIKNKFELNNIELDPLLLTELAFKSINIEATSASINSFKFDFPKMYVTKKIILEIDGINLIVKIKDKEDYEILAKEKQKENIFNNSINVALNNLSIIFKNINIVFIDDQNYQSENTDNEILTYNNNNYNNHKHSEHSKCLIILQIDKIEYYNATKITNNNDISSIFKEDIIINKNSVNKKKLLFFIGNYLDITNINIKKFKFNLKDITNINRHTCDESLKCLVNSIENIYVNNNYFFSIENTNNLLTTINKCKDNIINFDDIININYLCLLFRPLENDYINLHIIIANIKAKANLNFRNYFKLYGISKSENNAIYILDKKISGFKISLNVEYSNIYIDNLPFLVNNKINEINENCNNIIINYLSLEIIDTSYIIRFKEVTNTLFKISSNKQINNEISNNENNQNYSKTNLINDYGGTIILKKHSELYIDINEIKLTLSSLYYFKIKNTSNCNDNNSKYNNFYNKEYYTEAINNISDIFSLNILIRKIAVELSIDSYINLDNKDSVIQHNIYEIDKKIIYPFYESIDKTIKDKEFSYSLNQYINKDNVYVFFIVLELKYFIFMSQYQLTNKHYIHQSTKDIDFESNKMFDYMLFIKEKNKYLKNNQNKFMNFDSNDENSINENDKEKYNNNKIISLNSTINFENASINIIKSNTICNIKQSYNIFSINNLNNIEVNKIYNDIYDNEKCNKNKDNYIVMLYQFFSVIKIKEKINNFSFIQISKFFYCECYNYNSISFLDDKYSNNLEDKENILKYLNFDNIKKISNNSTNNKGSIQNIDLNINNLCIYISKDNMDMIRCISKIYNINKIIYKINKEIGCSLKYCDNKYFNIKEKDSIISNIIMYKHILTNKKSKFTFNKLLESDNFINELSINNNDQLINYITEKYILKINRSELINKPISNNKIKNKLTNNDIVFEEKNIIFNNIKISNISIVFCLDKIDPSNKHVKNTEDNLIINSEYIYIGGIKLSNLFINFFNVNNNFIQSLTADIKSIEILIYNNIKNIFEFQQKASNYLGYNTLYEDVFILNNNNTISNNHFYEVINRSKCDNLIKVQYLSKYNIDFNCNNKTKVIFKKNNNFSIKTPLISTTNIANYIKKKKSLSKKNCKIENNLYDENIVKNKCIEFGININNIIIDFNENILHTTLNYINYLFSYNKLINTVKIKSNFINTNNYCKLEDQNLLSLSDTTIDSSNYYYINSSYLKNMLNKLLSNLSSNKILSQSILDLNFINEKSENNISQTIALINNYIYKDKTSYYFNFKMSNLLIDYTDNNTKSKELINNNNLSNQIRQIIHIPSLLITTKLNTNQIKKYVFFYIDRLDLYLLKDLDYDNANMKLNYKSLDDYAKCFNSNNNNNNNYKNTNKYKSCKSYNYKDKVNNIVNYNEKESAIQCKSDYVYSKELINNHDNNVILNNSFDNLNLKKLGFVRLLSLYPFFVKFKEYKSCTNPSIEIFLNNVDMSFANDSLSYFILINKKLQLEFSNYIKSNNDNYHHVKMLFNSISKFQFDIITSKNLKKLLEQNILKCNYIKFNKNNKRRNSFNHYDIDKVHYNNYKDSSLSNSHNSSILESNNLNSKINMLNLLMIKLNKPNKSLLNLLVIVSSIKISLFKGNDFCFIKKELNYSLNKRNNNMNIPIENYNYNLKFDEIKSNKIVKYNSNLVAEVIKEKFNNNNNNNNINKLSKKYSINSWSKSKDSSFKPDVKNINTYAIRSVGQSFVVSDGFNAKINNNNNNINNSVLPIRKKSSLFDINKSKNNKNRKYSLQTKDTLNNKNYLDYEVINFNNCKINRLNNNINSNIRNFEDDFNSKELIKVNNNKDSKSLYLEPIINIPTNKTQCNGSKERHVSKEKKLQSLVINNNNINNYNKPLNRLRYDNRDVKVFILFEAFSLIIKLNTYKFETQKEDYEIMLELDYLKIYNRINDEFISQSLTNNNKNNDKTDNMKINYNNEEILKAIDEILNCKENSIKASKENAEILKQKYCIKTMFEFKKTTSKFIRIKFTRFKTINNNYIISVFIKISDLIFDINYRITKFINEYIENYNNICLCTINKDNIELINKSDIKDIHQEQYNKAVDIQNNYVSREEYIYNLINFDNSKMNRKINSNINNYKQLKNLRNSMLNLSNNIDLSYKDINLSDFLLSLNSFNNNKNLSSFLSLNNKSFAFVEEFHLEQFRINLSYSQPKELNIKNNLYSFKDVCFTIKKIYLNPLNRNYYINESILRDININNKKNNIKTFKNNYNIYNNSNTIILKDSKGLVISNNDFKIFSNQKSLSDYKHYFENNKDFIDIYNYLYNNNKYKSCINEYLNNPKYSLIDKNKIKSKLLNHFNMIYNCNLPSIISTVKLVYISLKNDLLDNHLVEAYFSTFQLIKPFKKMLSSGVKLFFKPDLSEEENKRYQSSFIYFMGNMLGFLSMKGLIRLNPSNKNNRLSSFQIYNN